MAGKATVLPLGLAATAAFKTQMILLPAKEHVQPGDAAVMAAELAGAKPGCTLN